MNMRPTRVASWAAIAALAVVLAGIFGYSKYLDGTSRSLMGNLNLGGKFNLIDHNGAPITEQALNGNPSALFFGFTHCPEVCPTTLYELASWFEALGPEGKGLRGFFFTLDPDRDTPEVMKSYVTAFSDRITGITGDPEAMAELARNWRITWEKIPLDDGDYTIDHTASVFLLDSDGKFTGTIAYRESAESAVEKIRRLIR